VSVASRCRRPVVTPHPAPWLSACTLPFHSTSLAAGHHCIFCDLIKGAAEVSMCYEDQQVIAFMDIQPVNQGHVLVVPREHYETLRDIPRDVGQHMYDVATVSFR
jgi:hypothetical protein